MENAQLRSMQIILIGLVSGVVAFAAMAFLFSRPQALSWTPLAGLGLLAGGFAALVGWTVPRLITRGLEQRLQKNPPRAQDLMDHLRSGYQQQLIVGAALLESGGFLNLVLSFLEPNYLFFCVAAVLVAMMALRLPTSAGVDQWMADRRGAITGRRNE